MGYTRRLLFCGLMIFICLPAVAQQTDINRYTLFTGFDYMISPARNLTERGFETDFGVTVRPWLGMGGDFGILGEDVISGAGTISGSETVYAPALSQVGVSPNSIHVRIQVNDLHLCRRSAILFAQVSRRSLFLPVPVSEESTRTANIAFPPQLGQLLQFLGQPIPNAHQTDTTYFVGLGGGFDLNVSRKVGLRFAADWVNTHLFSNLLTQPPELYPLLRWPDFPLGPFAVGAQAA